MRVTRGLSALNCGGSLTFVIVNGLCRHIVAYFYTGYLYKSIGIFLMFW